MESRILNPLPWAVWLLLIAVLGVEGVLWAAEHGLVNWPDSRGWRVQAIAHLGITPSVQDWMLATRQTPPEHVLRYLAYGFVHPGPAQAGLVAVVLAALGKACAEQLGSLRLLTVLVFVQMLSGLVFGLAAEPGTWLIGGTPLIFALAGAYAAIVLHGKSDARLSALGLVAVLVVARLVLVLLADGGAIWVADLVALALGYLAAHLLRPGLRVRLRRP